MLNTKKFILIGDNLYLDFINTRLMRGGRPVDLLGEKKDFLAWAAAAGLISVTAGEKMVESLTEGEFKKIKTFRDILSKMTEEIIDGKEIRPEFIAAINQQLRHKKGFELIEKKDGRLRRKFIADYARPIQLLAPVAEKAAQMITEEDPKYLKKCESDRCILYFYDSTKNHSRRWCSMSSCGNRAKARAFYRRKKRAGTDRTK